MQKTKERHNLEIKKLYNLVINKRINDHQGICKSNKKFRFHISKRKMFRNGYPSFIRNSIIKRFKTSREKVEKEKKMIGKLCG